MARTKKAPVMPEPFVLDGGNVIVSANAAGAVTVQTVGSLDAIFDVDATAGLAEWLDDVILATVLVDEDDEDDEDA